MSSHFLASNSRQFSRIALRCFLVPKVLLFVATVGQDGAKGENDLQRRGNIWQQVAPEASSMAHGVFRHWLGAVRPSRSSAGPCHRRAAGSDSPSFARPAPGADHAAWASKYEFCPGCKRSTPVEPGSVATYSVSPGSSSPVVQGSTARQRLFACPVIPGKCSARESRPELTASSQTASRETSG
jgi:hypothetical protein